MVSYINISKAFIMRFMFNLISISCLNVSVRLSHTWIIHSLMNVLLSRYSHSDCCPIKPCYSVLWHPFELLSKLWSPSALTFRCHLRPIRSLHPSLWLLENTRRHHNYPEEIRRFLSRHYRFPTRRTFRYRRNPITLHRKTFHYKQLLSLAGANWEDLRTWTLFHCQTGNSWWIPNRALPDAASILSKSAGCRFLFVSTLPKKIIALQPDFLVYTTARTCAYDAPILVRLFSATYQNKTMLKYRSRRDFEIQQKRSNFT